MEMEERWRWGLGVAWWEEGGYFHFFLKNEAKLIEKSQNQVTFLFGLLEMT